MRGMEICWDQVPLSTNHDAALTVPQSGHDQTQASGSYAAAAVAALLPNMTHAADPEFLYWHLTDALESQRQPSRNPVGPRCCPLEVPTTDFICFASLTLRA
jgi:hypothetical protein